MLSLFACYVYSPKAHRILDLILQFQYICDCLRKLVILVKYCLWRNQRAGYNHVSQWTDHLSTPQNNPCPWMVPKNGESLLFFTGEKKSTILHLSSHCIKSGETAKPPVYMYQKSIPWVVYQEPKHAIPL